MKKFALLILAAVAAVTPASAANPSANSGLDPNETVCRTVAVTGSRLGRTRRCATRAEWAQMLRAEREAMRTAQRQGNQPACMNPSERAAAAGRYYALPGGCQ